MATTGILLDFDTYTENLGGYDPNDEWSRDSSRRDNTLVSATALDQKEVLAYALVHGHAPSCDVVCGADVHKGDTVFIVWAEYTTGDSFGTDHGYVELVAAFVDETKANTWAEYLQTAGDSNCLIELEDGSFHDFYMPWHGYFESLERINVTEIVLS